MRQKLRIPIHELLIDIDIDGYHETLKVLADKYHFEYDRREKSGVK